MTKMPFLYFYYIVFVQLHPPTPILLSSTSTLLIFKNFVILFFVFQKIILWFVHRVSNSLADSLAKAGSSMQRERLEWSLS